MEKTSSESNSNSSGGGDEQKTAKASEEESPIMVVAVKPASNPITSSSEPKEKAEHETTTKKRNRGVSSRSMSPSLRDASPMVMSGSAKIEKSAQNEKKEAADKLKKSYSDLSHEIKDHINLTEIIARLDKELGEINDETENLDIILNGFSLCASSILSNTHVDEHEECVRAKNKFFKNVFLILLTVPNNLESVSINISLISILAKVLTKEKTADEKATGATKRYILKHRKSELGEKISGIIASGASMANSDTAAKDIKDENILKLSGEALNLVSNFFSELFAPKAEEFTNDVINTLVSHPQIRSMRLGASESEALIKSLNVFNGLKEDDTTYNREIKMKRITKGLFVTKKLESKAKSLKELGDVIKSAESGAKDAMFSKKDMAAWLRKETVDKKLFGDGFLDYGHIDLARLNLPIIVFSLDNGVIPEDGGDVSIVDRLWEQSVGQHDSVKTCIYNTIIQLFSHLPEREVAELVARVKEVKEADVDNPTLQFVSTLVIKCYTDKNAKKAQLDMFPQVELLWRAMFSSAKSLSEYAEGCLRRLAAKLAGPEDDSAFAVQFRTFVVDEFKKAVFEPTKSPNGLLRYFILLKDFVELCFGKKGSKKIPSVSQVLSTEFPEILNVMLQDLVSYCKYAANSSKKGAELRGAGTPSAALSAAYLDDTNTFKHSASVSGRLACISFVLENTPNGNGIAGKDAVLLWNALSEVVPEDRERCVEWLLKCMADTDTIRCRVEDKAPATCFFSVDATREFFEECLMTEKDESFACNGKLFTLFYRLFLLLNVVAGNKSKKPVICYKKQRSFASDNVQTGNFFADNFYANLQNVSSDGESFEMKSFGKLLAIGAARGNSNSQGAECIINLVAKNKALSLSMRTSNFNILLEKFIEGKPNMVSFALNFFSGMAKFRSEDLFDFAFSSAPEKPSGSSESVKSEPAKDGKGKGADKADTQKPEIMEFALKFDSDGTSGESKTMLSSLKNMLRSEKEKNIKVVWTNEQQQQQQSGVLRQGKFPSSGLSGKKADPIIVSVQAKKTDTIADVKKKIILAVVNNQTLGPYVGDSCGFPFVPSDLTISGKNGKPIDEDASVPIGKFSAPYFIQIRKVPRRNFIDHIDFENCSIETEDASLCGGNGNGSSPFVTSPASVTSVVPRSMSITKREDGANILGKETFEFLKLVFIKKKGEKDPSETLTSLVSDNIESISEDEAIATAKLLTRIFLFKQFAQEGSDKGEESVSLDEVITNHGSNKFLLLLKMAELCACIFGAPEKKKLTLTNEKVVTKFLVDDLAKSGSKLDFLIFELVVLTFSKLGGKFKIGKKTSAFKLVQYFLNQTRDPTTVYAGISNSVVESVECLVLANILRGNDVVLQLLNKNEGKKHAKEEGESKGDEAKGKVNECFEPLLFNARSRLIRACTAERVKSALMDLGDSEPEYAIHLHSFFSEKCVTAPYESIFELYAALLNGGHSEIARRMCSEESVLLLMDTVRAHETSETSAEPSAPDPVLNGVLGMLNTILRKDRQLAEAAVGHNKEAFETFITHDLVGDCLFNTPEVGGDGHSKSLPKCKSPKSRQTAFCLLGTLSGLGLFTAVSEGLSRVVLGVDPGDLAVQVKSINATRRPPIGYLGLRNQGATCYMNSLLQQLYLNPAFKDFVLSIRDCPSTRNAEAFEPDYDTVYQLQRLFAEMQESFGTYVETKPFCATVRDFEGFPISLVQQMDANEFYNTLFDKIENVTRALPCGNMAMKDNFQITSVTQIVCEEDEEHVSEANEPCYTISVEIKNKKNIRDAIETYIRGETLSGDNQYFCSKCNKKVNALKKCYFKSLPQTLVIHLKRFEFHMDIMRNIKLNDYCEFPMELNMEEYCRNTLSSSPSAADGEQSRPPGYYDYRLTGIVVHSGTADGGHYYSYHRDNCPPYAQWLEFNDSTVTYFDKSQIPRECYGGKRTVESKNPETQAVDTKEVDVSHSAYILFYERVSNEMRPSAVPGRYVSPCIQKELRDEIWVENFRKIKVSNVYNDNFLNFVLGLTDGVLKRDSRSDESGSDGGYNKELVLSAFKTMFFMFCNVIVKFKDKNDISKWIRRIGLYVERYFCVRKWFVDFVTNSTLFVFQKIFFANGFFDKNRIEFIDLLVHSLSFFAKKEGKYLVSIDTKNTEAKNMSLISDHQTNVDEGEKESNNDKKKKKKKKDKKKKDEKDDDNDNKCVDKIDNDGNDEKKDAKIDNNGNDADKVVKIDNEVKKDDKDDKKLSKEDKLIDMFFGDDSEVIHWNEDYDSKHISVFIPFMDSILAFFAKVRKKWSYSYSASMFYLIVRCFMKSDPNITKFLLERRNFMVRAIQFFLCKLTEPMEAPVGLVTIDDTHVHSNGGDSGDNELVSYGYSTSNLGGLIEVITVLIKSRPLSKSKSEGDDKGDGKGSDSECHSADDVALFGPFVKELLASSGDYVEYGVEIAVYLCECEKEMFKFFLGLFETEILNMTSTQMRVNAYEKLMSGILLINDENREWRAEEFVKSFVKILKKFSDEFASKKMTTYTFMSFLETFGNIYRLSERVLYTAYKSKQREIDKLVRATGEFNLVFN